MRINMTNKLYESVQSANKDTNSLRNKAILESVSKKIKIVESEGDAICPKCGEKYDSRLAAISRFDNETKICSDCGTAEALENMYGSVSDPHVYDTTMNEEVNVDSPKDDKKEIEDRIGELKVAIDDEALSEDEKEKAKKELAELENSLNESKVLKEYNDDGNWLMYQNQIEDILDKAEAGLGEDAIGDFLQGIVDECKNRAASYEIVLENAKEVK